MKFGNFVCEDDEQYDNKNDNVTTGVTRESLTACKVIKKMEKVDTICYWLTMMLQTFYDNHCHHIVTFHGSGRPQHVLKSN